MPKRTLICDRYRMPLSTSSSEAATYFSDAVHLMLTDNFGALKLFDNAIKIDRKFALAVTAALRMRQVSLGRKVEVTQLKKLREAAKNCSVWERAHINLMCQLMAGTLGDQARAMGRHLKKFPHDVMMFNFLSGYLFFFGGFNKKEKITEFFKFLAPHYKDDPYFTGRHAFHLQELNNSQAALALAESTLKRSPRNAFAAHAKVHVLHENKKFGASLKFIRAWMKKYDNRSALASHMRWHEALALVNTGQFKDADAIYRRYIKPSKHNGSLQLRLADAVEFLWRRELMGRTNSDREIRDLRAVIKVVLTQPLLAFTSIHVGLFFALCEDAAALAALRKKLKGQAVQNDRALTNYVRSIVEALQNLVKGEASTAAARLRSLDRNGFEAIGGSNIERQLLSEIIEHARKTA